MCKYWRVIDEKWQDLERTKHGSLGMASEMSRKDFALENFSETKKLALRVFTISVEHCSW